MTRLLLIAFVAAAVLALAIGGWTVRGIRWVLVAGPRRLALPAT